VFRGVAGPAFAIGVAGNVGLASFTDREEAPGLSCYLVSARNACGSSGEEPF
jgi:hypothetical protein